MSVKVIRSISGFGEMFIETQTALVVTPEDLEDKASKSTLSEVEKRLTKELALLKGETESAYKLANTTQKQLQSTRKDLSDSIRQWKEELELAKTEVVAAFRDALQEDVLYNKYEQMISDHLARMDRELQGTLKGLSARQDEIHEVFSGMETLIEEFKRLHEQRRMEEKTAQEQLDGRIGLATSNGQAAWRWVREVQSLSLFERIVWLITGRLPSQKH